MPIFLHGLALTNYRGVGPKTQKMAPFKNFNFFIGANNSGKSSVLSFISRHLRMPTGSVHGGYVGPALDELERYKGGTAGATVMSFGVPKEQFISTVQSRYLAGPSDARSRQFFGDICNVLSDNGFIWLQTDVGTNKPLELFKMEDLKSQVLEEDYSRWKLLWCTLADKDGGGFQQHWFPESTAIMVSAQTIELPRVNIIPAIRQISLGSDAFTDYSGKGLIPRLAEIQSPDHDKRTDRDLFDEINKFLSSVTGRSGSSIEIPHNRAHILVHMDGRTLPLSSLGTGIEEVIMIAAFCTLSNDQIICIEEPEIHLHPLLQRKLIRYLQENTSNKYFIATHSASLIDTPGSAIFHVSQENDQTTIREAVLRSERHAICVDLGTRASDIVQANAVIWVEGPSDRIYIEHWISTEAPDLIEGIHYSIMFYGGRLLNHLCADDDAINEFINLRALNQNIALVIDSDKKTRSTKLNATKQRLVAEFKTNPRVAWVTKGREIENYVEHDVLQAAVKVINPKTYDKPAERGLYDHALYFVRLTAKRRKKGGAAAGLIEDDVDKVKVAREVCKHPANLDVLDLRARIVNLVEMIKSANL